MITNDNKITSKNINYYVCTSCDFKCSKKGDYNRHINTNKHKNMTNDNDDVKLSTNKTYTCSKCHSTYKFKSGLSRHIKTCNKQQQLNPNDTENESKTNTEMIMLLIKENNELKNMMMEILKNGTHNTTNNNSHNKTFNLQFFLNDTCKNAMNIMDFVNNLQLQLDDLEKMGEIGYVNGMSNIIIKNLKDMDVTERPVHCTDAKREVLYVKDEDKWDKETSDKPKIRKAIKHVAHKNARLLQEFKEKHPDCTKSESKHSDTYTKLMVEAMGGKGSNDDEQESKIIKKVSKEITLAEVNP